MLVIAYVTVAALVACGGTTRSTAEPGAEEHDGTANAGGSAGGQQAGMPATGGRLGAEPVTCGGVVRFRLESAIASNALTFCLGKPGSCAGSGAWLEVFDAEGREVLLSRYCSLTDCSECQAPACPADCPQSAPLADEGVEAEWNGVRWNGGQVCGGDNLQCVTPACAEPGSYTARFCAFGARGAGNDPSPFSWCELNAEPMPTCVEVPFELPSSGTILGVLQPDG